jgi:uncharacterized protein (DUF3820 family)
MTLRALVLSFAGNTPVLVRFGSMDSEALVKLVTMKMPFGKHAGRVLADLPGNYLTWFAREGFPKGELGQLLELMHTLDHNGLRGLLAPIQRAHGIAPRSRKQ